MEHRKIMIFSIILLTLTSIYCYAQTSEPLRYTGEEKENLWDFVLSRWDMRNKNMEKQIGELLIQLKSENINVADKAERNIIELGPYAVVRENLDKAVKDENILLKQRAQKIVDLFNKLLDNIDKDNYEISNKMLEENVNKKNIDIISISLTFDHNYEIKQKAAEALGEIGDKKAVPKLIYALLDNNQEPLAFQHNPPIFGGDINKQRTAKENLEKAIVTALEKLTELNFRDKNLSFSFYLEIPRDALAIIKICDKWWEENKEKINKEQK